MDALVVIWVVIHSKLQMSRSEKQGKLAGWSLVPVKCEVCDKC